LATAVARRRCGIIPAHGTLHWKVMMQIDPGGKNKP